MRFVPSFILLVVVAYVGVIGEEAGEEPSTHQGSYNNPGVVVGRQAAPAGYVYPPNYQTQRLVQLLLTVEVVKLISRLLTRTTTTTAGPVTTTVVPADWKTYKGCQYQASNFPATAAVAASTCVGFGVPVGLAHKNVRTAADRLALFQTHLGLTGSVWLGLTDTDGSGTTDAKWSNGDDYASASGVSETYSDGTASSRGSAIAPTFNNIDFSDTSGAATKFYVCEYCP